MLTSTLTSSFPPTRRKELVSTARRSLTWTESGISPISSRNRVPLLASSKQPSFLACAPVNAPFSCPKSSLSTSSEGIAPQLTFTIGFRSEERRVGKEDAHQSTQ